MSVFLECRNNLSNVIVYKEQEYYDYIVDHVKRVQQMYEKLFVNNMGVLSTNSISRSEYIKAIKDCKECIMNHDSSKYGEEEFDPYRVNYYPTDLEKQMINDDQTYADTVSMCFENAWVHHYSNNNHHPQFWCLDMKGNIVTPRDMPLAAIIHMVCDWFAMSSHFKTSTTEWYKNAEKEKSCMSFQTKLYVEEILEYFKEKDVEFS